MWIADKWEDYELLDCGGGEKLERWGRQILVRPDPQAIWETPHANRGWKNAQGRYHRSSTGGGHWDKEKLPELLRGLNKYRMLIYSIVLIVVMIVNWAPAAIEKREKLAAKFHPASSCNLP